MNHIVLYLFRFFTKPLNGSPDFKYALEKDNDCLKKEKHNLILDRECIDGAGILSYPFLILLFINNSLISIPDINCKSINYKWNWKGNVILLGIRPFDISIPGLNFRLISPDPEA